MIAHIISACKTYIFDRSASASDMNKFVSPNAGEVGEVNLRGRNFD